MQMNHFLYSSPLTAKSIASQIDDAVQDCVLLRRVKGSDRDIDRYFRLVANHEGADRTFVCPPDYSSITRKEKRIEEFFQGRYEGDTKGTESYGV